MTVGPWIGALISRLARACAQRPVTTLAVSLALAATAVACTVHGLGFVTSPLRLLPQHARYVTLLREYLDDFGELNDIVVVVETPEPGQAKAYAERLVADLRGAGLGQSRITYRLDPAYFERRALLYLSMDELTRLRDRLYDYQEFVAAYAARPTLDELLRALNQQIANAMVLGFFDVGVGPAAGRDDLRFLEALLEQIDGRLDGHAGYASPWGAAFSLGRLDDPDAGWFFSSDRRLLFLFVEQQRREGSFTDNRGRIEAIRRTIAALAPEFPGVRAGVTGGPAISNDEMVTAFADSQVATLLALAVTLALLLVAFRRVVKPVLMLLTLAVSLAWSMGLITLTVGHLSIFSVMFISIVIGIGIDYGIYYLFRYEEELALGQTVAGALHRAAERTGPGMLLGALTAAGAFFVLLLTDFQGIREFGAVSGIAVLMSFVGMVTLFPALLVLADRGRVRAARPAPPAPGADRRTLSWLEDLSGWHRTILAGAAILTLIAAWGAARVQFSYNLLRLQAKGVESVAWEERILATAGRSGTSALATARTLDDLRRKQDAFAALGSVARVESLLLVLPDRQPEKTVLIKELGPLLDHARVAPAPAPDPPRLRGALETLRRRLSLAAEGAPGGEGADEVRRVRDRVDAVLARLAALGPEAARARLERLQAEVRRDFADKLRRFRQSLDPPPIAAGDIAPELRQRYIGRSGQLLIRIQPAVDIWQREGAERFVGDLRGVDPDVTGPPVTSFEAGGLIRRGYVEGTLYALVLVAVVTAVLLRSVRGTALALAPLGLGMVWTLGLMSPLGLDFNLANVWALPLILGTAAEYGLNIFVRFLEGREGGGPVLARSAVLAVVLNGLTTIGGFGSLMVAHHRGIFGLGLLLTLGAAASLLAALVVLPVLIRLFGRARPLPSQ